MAYPIRSLKSCSNGACSSIPYLCIWPIGDPALIQISHTIQSEGIAGSIGCIGFDKDCIFQWIGVADTIVRCYCTGFRNTNLWVVDDLKVISSIDAVGCRECLLSVGC